MNKQLFEHIREQHRHPEPEQPKLQSEQKHTEAAMAFSALSLEIFANK